MANQLSHRLTAHDAAFLYLERSSAPLHIGSLGIYEGELPFERFVSHIESRLPNIPRYRQKVCFLPFSIAQPTWEDDPAFDIRKHIFRVDLPPPGDERQLRGLSARLFAEPLDRDKPLWEMYVIHGVQGGNSAILSKVHHCMVDGVSGIQLLMAVVDITPEPAPPPEPDNWQPAPWPDVTKQLSDAFWDNLGEQRRLWDEFRQSIADPSRPVKQSQDLMRAFGAAAPFMLQPAPRLPFATTLEKERTFAFNDTSFVEIREIRTALGGTVNDVVLAILAGALRRYLPQRGIEVDGIEPRVAIPVNVRLENEQGALGNRVSAMFAALPVGEPDPARRLELVQERTTTLKESNQAGAMELLLRLPSLIPVPVQVLGSFAVTNTMVNFICTNVPGPMIPLYSVGHLLLAHYPLVPLSLNMGLGFGVTSYNQKLTFGLAADPNVVPDIDELKRCIDASFLELRAAAGVSPTDIPALATRGNGHNGRPEPGGITLPKREPVS